jgi:hypothetical protein
MKSLPAIAVLALLCSADPIPQPECTEANHGRFWPEEANADRALARRLYQSGELEMCSLTPPKYSIYWRYKWQHVSVNAKTAAKVKGAQPSKAAAEPSH